MPDHSGPMKLGRTKFRFPKEPAPIEKPPFKPEITIHGYPVPWSLIFHDKDGEPFADFKTLNPERAREGLDKGLCGVCGRKLPKDKPIAWLGGSRNPVFLDLPMHLVCARYSARVCPFLAGQRIRPDMADSGDYSMTVGIGVEELRTPDMKSLQAMLRGEATEPVMVGTGHTRPMKFLERIPITELRVHDVPAEERGHQRVPAGRQDNSKTKCQCPLPGMSTCRILLDVDDEKFNVMGRVLCGACYNGNHGSHY